MGQNQTESNRRGHVAAIVMALIIGPELRSRLRRAGFQS